VELLPQGCKATPAKTTLLAAQKVLDLLDEDVAAYVGNGVGEGNPFRTDFDAVLRETALLDATIAGQGAEPFFLEDLAGWMVVKELHLGDGRGSNEVRFLIELRADFHTAAATDAIGEWIADFLLLRENARAHTQIVGSVDGNPGLDGLEVLEKN
jgi:hypothetical protein